jgi:hypothetical protein
MVPAGKILVLIGSITLALGILLLLFSNIPFLGKLPGDMHFKRGKVEIHLPLGTSLLLSALLSGILWAISYFKGR